GMSCRRESTACRARTVRRLVRSYGLDTLSILGGKTYRAGPLGEDFGQGLFQAEVDWLIAREWAHTAEDILWRRTKLGLRFSQGGEERLKDYLAEALSQRIAAA
ncbi:MAG: glycerol-3-phosphate dehydrogenase, partial [Hyphomicrobiales bacterium]